jgi:hypothetical protein
MWEGWVCRWGRPCALARNTAPTRDFAGKAGGRCSFFNFFATRRDGRPHAGRRSGSQDLPTVIGENLFRCVIP